MLECGMSSNPQVKEGEIRNRLFSGARLLLDDLTDDELAALQPMLTDGEAEIINEACKPYVIRKLPRW